jgi:hypothetical protein
MVEIDDNNLDQDSKKNNQFEFFFFSRNFIPVEYYMVMHLLMY